MSDAPLRDDVRAAIGLLEGVADELEDMEPDDDIDVEEVVRALREQAETLTFAAAGVAAIEQSARGVSS